MRVRLAAHLFQFLDSCQTIAETRQLHALLITTHLSPYPSIATKLLRSYAASDDILSAHLIFDQARQVSIYLWNSIIRAHAQRHDFSRALSLFTQMRSSDTKPDRYTFACILRACAENSDRSGARTTHGLLISFGLSSDRIASSALVSAYSKLGLIDDAAQVFDRMGDPDLVLWNSMISGYGYGGSWQKGLEKFHRMRNSGERPDGYTMVGLISCFWDPIALQVCRGIHGLCFKGGYDSSAHVRSMLVSMYLRCNCLESGYQIFQALPQADLVTWSALITGFSQAGKCKQSLNLFREMNKYGKTPDPILIAGVLSTCATMAIVGPSKEIHGYVFRFGVDLDIAVMSALIDAYTKCGFSNLGFQVFQMMPKKNLVSYNTVISSLGCHGFGQEAICVFKELLDEGFVPDKATLSAVLCACCHSRLVDEGWELFTRMQSDFGVEAQMEHYVYMVKLLGLVGMVEEAYKFIQTMPILPDSGVWGALLWACSVHGRSDLGEIAAQRLFEIDPNKSAYRIMLSNIYAAEEKWEQVDNLRYDMKDENLQKNPGISWLGDCSI